MPKLSPDNERIKHRYFEYLKEAKKFSVASVDSAAKAIARFEESNGGKSFKAFHRRQAIAFKNRLSDQLNSRTGERLSRATVHSTLSALRAFTLWLADQPGYKSRVTYADADYFNLSEKEVRIAKAVRPKAVPTLEQIHHVIARMPARTDIEKRDRALVAFTILTGARDGAIIGFKLKHLNIPEGLLDQDPREVNTKFSKPTWTWFFPVGGQALEIVTDWVAHLCSLHWGDGEPLFPATLVGQGENNGFVAAGLSRQHWTSAGPVRRVCEQAFTSAGLPYFNPHSFRATLARLGERECRTPEEFMTWAQNLSHTSPLTTFTSYGEVPLHRQGEIMREIGKRTGKAPVDPLAAHFAELKAQLIAELRPNHA